MGAVQFQVSIRYCSSEIDHCKKKGKRIFLKAFLRTMNFKKDSSMNFLWLHEICPFTMTDVSVSPFQSTKKKINIKIPHSLQLTCKMMLKTFAIKMAESHNLPYSIMFFLTASLHLKKGRVPKGNFQLIETNHPGLQVQTCC